MNETLKQSEIDELLAALESMIQTKPITHITPAEINQITDAAKQAEYKRNFEIVNYLYFRPLEKLLKNVTESKGLKYYALSYGEISIVERIVMVEKLLIQQGYTNDQVKKMVPQNLDDVEIIVKACQLGFKDEEICYNDNRVINAQTYLVNNKTIANNNSKNIA